MVTPRKLAKPPIREALIDIRVKLRAEFDVKEFDALYARVAKDYPLKLERWAVSTHINLQEGMPTEPTFRAKQRDGYWFKSADEKQVLQAKLQGFTFNKLSPYTSWDSFRGEAFRLWKLYAEVARPESITRVALRYINDVEIPSPIQNLAEFLTIPPPVPPALPHLMTGFFTRAVIREEKLGAAGFLTVSLEPSLRPDSWLLVLDIDAFKETLFESDGVLAWQTVDALRILKNKLFFEAITAKTASPFQ